MVLSGGAVALLYRWASALGGFECRWGEFVSLPELLEILPEGPLLCLLVGIGRLPAQQGVRCLTHGNGIVQERKPDLEPRH